MSEPKLMKALNFADFNRLELVDVPVPALTEPDDVLVRVRAVGVCGSDLHGYTGKTGRRKPPLIMGHEAAGEVAAVGSAVERVQPGNRVSIQPLVYRPDPETGRVVRRLIGMNLPGAYAEYVVVPEANVYSMPDTLTFEAASLTEPLAVAVRAVGTVHVRPYDNALVIGAGTIGLLAMQVLLLAGVRQVTICDITDARLAVAGETGAKRTINPQTQDFDAQVGEITSGQGFDVVFEAVGVSATVGQSLKAIRDGGTVVWIGNNQRIVDVDMQAIVTRELHVAGTYGMKEPDFQRALQMLADGRIATAPLVSRRATLDEGPGLFDELLADTSVVKCVVEV